MKLTLINFCVVTLLATVMLSMRADNGRKELLAHTWVQFAFKKNGASFASLVDKTAAKTCIFNNNGSYTESTYNSGVKISGDYFLNGDQSKIAIKFSVLNGQALPYSTDTSKHYNIIILRLTQDTLIYGQEARYGERRTYGHDDWYFVRKK